MILVSVIVLTYNSEDHIEKCLGSVVAQNYKDLEIVVIDNGSRDKTLEIINSLGYKLKLIRNKKNRGVAKARNQGIRESKGRYILFLDDDAYLSQNCLFLLVDYLEKNDNVALVGPKILYPDGRLQFSCRRFPTPLAVLFRGTFLGKRFSEHPIISSYLMKDFDHEGTRAVDWVLGACQMIRKEVFDKVGLLDENYFFGYEDIEFCRRLKKNNLLVNYFPGAVVYHHYQRRSASGLISKSKFVHIRSIIRYFISH